MNPQITRFAGRHYHFIGIGGIGMSSLARLLLAWGANVSGSDRVDSPMLHTVESEGAAVTVGHDAANLSRNGRPDVVVYSKAVPDDNPELAEARHLGIAAIHRAELLRDVMAGRNAVCICGTHGKTTTAAMLSLILQEAGQDPAVMLGGDYPPIGGNVRRGQGPAFVAEACEAYGSFMSLYPDIAVVTNIEADHLDRGATFESIRDSFRIFLRRVPSRGIVVAGVDSPEVRKILPGLSCRLETYSVDMSEGSEAGAADWTVKDLDQGLFEILFKGEPITVVRLHVPGRHNISNALAAIAAAHSMGVQPQESARTLDQFTGVDRRFTILGAAAGVMVVDDYAHHPTEIRATLDAARELLGRSQTTGSHPSGNTRISLPPGFTPRSQSRLVAVFQPHLYSRTSIFMDEFVRAMTDAEVVFITEIYAAREEPEPGVTGAELASRIRRHFPAKTVDFIPDLEQLAVAVSDRALSGDLVVTMGAGDITTVGPEILESLRKTANDGARERTGDTAERTMSDGAAAR